MLAMGGEPLTVWRDRQKGETLSDRSTDQTERSVWQPSQGASGQGTVRVIGPTQDVAAAAIYNELLEIAERALGDRTTAERLVSGIFRGNGQLVAAASHTVSSAQRETAKTELVRMVRRAALDALPPVVATLPTAESAPAKGTAKGTAKKLRPVGKTSPAMPSKPAATTVGRGPALLFVALVIALGGGALMFNNGLWSTSDGPEGGALPASGIMAQPPGEIAAPTADTALAESAPEPIVAPDGDLLKLEAAEPELGPIREATSTGAPDSTPQPDDTVPVAVAAGLRVFILYPDGAGAEDAAGDLYAALSNSGEFPLVVLRDVDFAIETPRIRYFYSQDANAADALAGVLEPPGNSGDQWTVQDFTQFRPLPAPGTLEIFIPSS